MVPVKFTLSPTPFTRRPNPLEKPTHVFLCLSRFIRCLYSIEPPVSSSMIEFYRILRYWWYIISYGVLWEWAAMSAGSKLL